MDHLMEQSAQKLKNIAQNHLPEVMCDIRLLLKPFTSNSHSDTQLLLLGSTDKHFDVCYNYNTKTDKFQRFYTKVRQHGIFINIPKRRFVTHLFTAGKCLYLQELNTDTMKWVENSKQLIDDNIATISIRNQAINSQIIKCIPIFDYLVVIFGIEDELVVKIYQYSNSMDRNSLIVTSKQLIGSKHWKVYHCGTACIFYHDDNNNNNYKNYEVLLFGGHNVSINKSFRCIKLCFDHNKNFVPLKNWFDEKCKHWTQDTNVECIPGYTADDQFHSFSYDLFNYGRLKFLILTGGVKNTTARQNGIIVFNFRSRKWNVCQKFRLPKRMYRHNSIVVDEDKYCHKPRMYIMGGVRSYYTMGINWKIDLQNILKAMKQILTWDQERIIWIAFYKNLNNHQKILF